MACTGATRPCWPCSTTRLRTGGGTGGEGGCGGWEPRPGDCFAGVRHKPELAPARIGALRDKLTELKRCGVHETVVLPFDAALAAQSPEDFIEEVLVRGLGVRYVLV